MQECKHCWWSSSSCTLLRRHDSAEVEVLLPVQTDWGLPVKKSRIHFQREVFTPPLGSSSLSVPKKLLWWVKFLNSLRILVSILFKWLGGRWRVIAIASSVEQLGRYINCRGSMVGQAGLKKRVSKNLMRLVWVQLDSSHWGRTQLNYWVQGQLW